MAVLVAERREDVEGVLPIGDGAARSADPQFAIALDVLRDASPVSDSDFLPPEPNRYERTTWQPPVAPREAV